MAAYVRTVTTVTYMQYKMYWGATFWLKCTSTYGQTRLSVCQCSTMVLTAKFHLCNEFTSYDDNLHFPGPTLLHFLRKRCHCISAAIIKTFSPPSPHWAYNPSAVARMYTEYNFSSPVQDNQPPDCQHVEVPEAQNKSQWQQQKTKKQKKVFSIDVEDLAHLSWAQPHF